MTAISTFGRTSRKASAAPESSECLLDWDDLYDMGVRFHHNHARRLWTAGKFPKPIKLGPRKLAWRKSDVEKWIATKIAEQAGE